MPSWLVDSTIYLTLTGSVSYGCSTDVSDADVVGVVVPPKRYLFPEGEIEGFSTPGPRFAVWQKHHVDVKGLWGSREQADFALYSIAKYARLAMDNNPNAIDILFAPTDCVLLCSPAFAILRDARKLFLHKGSYHKFRGYAHSQLAKIRTKDDLGNIDKVGNRREIIERYGFDTKFAYHVMRLALECEQILEGGDLDLRRDRELYKAVRRGDWTLLGIQEWWAAKERYLESLYQSSALRMRPNEAEIKAVLMRALNEHWGSTEQPVSDSDARLASQRQALLEIASIAERGLR